MGKKGSEKGTKMAKEECPREDSNLRFHGHNVVY